MDYDILVGKNAASNEKLTFAVGNKNDLWLHARDIAGSHVLVRSKSSRTIPRPVIQRAAELAAYFSKNRNNSMCPVIYTFRKYIRKVKGGNAGQVVVEREEIIFVKPAL